MAYFYYEKIETYLFYGQAFVLAEPKKTSLYTQNKPFAGSSLPAETKALRTDGPIDGPTDGPRDQRMDTPLIELWLTTNRDNYL